MPYFAGGFIATAFRTAKSALYETSIAIINFAGNMASTAFGTLIYVNTSLPEYVAKITYNNSSMTPIPELIINGIEYNQVIKAIAVGAPVVVSIGALIAWIIDFLKDTNHFDATVNKLLNHPTPPEGYYAFSEQTSELSAFIKRAWPILTTTLSGALGSWWLGYSATEFSQVFAATSLSTLATMTGVVTLGYGGYEIYQYRQRQKMLRSTSTAVEIRSAVPDIIVSTVAPVLPHHLWIEHSQHNPYTAPNCTASYAYPTLQSPRI